MQLSGRYHEQQRKHNSSNLIIIDTYMDFPPELNYERLLAPLLEFNVSSFVPEPYIPPRAISSAHRQPRFGRPNTLDGVFTGYKSQTREYVTGVIIGSLIIAIVAIVWFFAIICLKIAGTKRVGFLAGRFVRPYSNREEKGYGGADCEIVDGDEIWSRSVVGGENNETIRAKSMENSTHYLRAPISFGRRVGIVRVLFVLSGIAVIISGVFCFLLRCAFCFALLVSHTAYLILFQEDYSTEKVLCHSKILLTKFRKELTWSKMYVKRLWS